MRVVFMGTPDFAVPSFQKLKQEHEIVAVVTVPDKPAGRGRQLRPSAVKLAAMDAGVPVLQPDSLKDPEFIEQLSILKADLFAVVAFRILPEIVFTMPPSGTVNLHASLLPRLRGAAPINWALINGDKQSGITTFYIEKKVDTGNILLQQSVELHDNMTAGDLHDLLSEHGSELLLKTVNGIASHSLHAVQQQGEVTLAPKITKELCAIDWSQSATHIHNLVRGLSPFPGAFSLLKKKNLKILFTGIAHETKDTGSAPGTIISADKSNGCLVQTGNGVIKLLQVKPEGKRAMSIEEYLHGYALQAGAQFVNHE